MKKIISLLVCLTLTATISAKTGAIKGQYTFQGSTTKGVHAWILGKQDTTKLDKKGRFRLKNVNYDQDTLAFESFKGQAVIVPLNGNNIVKVERSETKTEIILNKEKRKPTATYGGIIYTREDLEQTGETSVWKAIMVKNPQPTFSSFYKSSSPLCFVDRVEVYVLDLPVKEVAFVEVVKATNAGNSAWGVRGANGAILVTTDVKWKSMLDE